MKIIETVESRKSDFVFKTLANTSGFDLWSAAVGSSMDQIYLANRSGQKPVSLMVHDDYDTDTQTLDLSDLAAIIKDTYFSKWKHLIDDLNTEYLVDKDIDWTEEEEIDMAYSRDLERASEGESGSVTNTGSKTVVTDQVAAFNSGLKDAAETTTEGNKLDNEEEVAASSSDSGTENEDRTEAGTKSKSHTGRTKPFIELLKNDFSFWQSTSLLDIIFSDVDKLLTLPYYD